MDRILVIITLTIIQSCGKAEHNVNSTAVTEKVEDSTIAYNNLQFDDTQTSSANPDSLYRRGVMLFNEDTENPDYSKTYELLKKAGELGSSDALTFLGIELIKGQRLNKDVKEGVVLLKDAVELKNSRAMRELSYYSWKNRDYSISISLLKEATELSDGFAAFDLANIYLYAKPYYNDEILENESMVDKIKGLKYLLMASEMNNPDAQIQLGIIYLKGLSDFVEKDDSKAKDMFKKAYNNPSLIETPGGRDNIEMILQDEFGDNWETWLNPEN